MAYKTDTERVEAIRASKRSYWSRHRVRLVKEAKKRYERKRPEGWLDGRRKAVQARVPIAELVAAATGDVQRNALLGIREVQERVLEYTHGSLKEWSSTLAKTILEGRSKDGVTILAPERAFIAEQLAILSSHSSALVDKSLLRDLANKMAAQTRDADSCLREMGELLTSRRLLSAYTECKLYVDLNVC